MLHVDLAQLERAKRLRIDVSIPADDPMWEGADWSLSGPLAVRLEAQRVGPDVVVRGELAGTAELPCRRCLTPVRVDFDEDVTLLFRAGLTPAEAELEDAYALPTRATELDLTGPVREHVHLGIPRFVSCSETCKGFCPHCGADLNRGECGCAPHETDERWAVLRRLARD